MSMIVDYISVKERGDRDLGTRSDGERYNALGLSLKFRLPFDLILRGIGDLKERIPRQGIQEHASSTSLSALPMLGQKKPTRHEYEVILHYNFYASTTPSQMTLHPDDYPNIYIEAVQT
jgi:hypothetical protein